ncbi:MAG: peptidyl-prolyl cis-trans isomerase [Phycisphaerales bacterium]|nr:peptidyl-prolyl cis-trans isomerase [Phycisphaerales bacterium]
MHARSAIHLGASAALPVLAVASLLSALVGCGSGRSSAQPALRLTPQDFAAAPSIANQGQAAVTATPVSVSGSAVTPGEAILVVGDQGAASPWAARSVPAPAKFAPVTAPGATSQAQPALAAAPPAPAAPPAGALVVDQMVGEINGKPLYASDFLQPLDARLRAEAQRLSPREWLQSTARTVHAALIDQVRDELLLAEFYASLKPEQRAGVLAYIQRLRTNIVSQNLGAEALADERLREREGLTIEEKVKQESERQLILEQLRREVYSRVVVSYRDIERYYETHFDEFNQAPSIKLRVIRANPDDADAVARALLDKPFAEVAAQYTKYNTSEQGLLVVSEPAAGTAPVFFGPQQLNDPAQALGVGETVGPIGYAGDEWWINYEALERNARTLYEAQDDIEAQLRQERFQVEQDRFFGEMLERARISDLETMVQRIVEFAAVRYLPNAGQ